MRKPKNLYIRKAYILSEGEKMNTMEVLNHELIHLTVREVYENFRVMTTIMHRLNKAKKEGICDYALGKLISAVCLKRNEFVVKYVEDVLKLCRGCDYQGDCDFDAVEYLIEVVESEKR